MTMDAATIVATILAATLLPFIIIMSGILPAFFRSLQAITIGLAGVPQVTLPILLVFGFMYVHNKWSTK